MRYTRRSEQERTSRSGSWRQPAFFLLLMAFLLVGAQVVRAQVATTYSSSKRVLKVGILLLDSTDINDGRGAENPDPFIFYIADTRTDIKPQNWEFVNPLSPKVVSNDAASRWTARTSGNGPQYQVGQQVTKNMACYWEVPLTDTPLQDLLQFDVLFITHHRTMRFSPADREKLRKLVDAGGIVWIEDCGGMRIQPGSGGGDPPGPFLLDQLQFSGGRADSPGPSGTPGPVINVPNHPLLNSPYPLTQQEIANLGDKDYYNYALVNLYDISRAPNPETLVNIVGNAARANLPYIAAGTYGAGRVIATAGDSGCDINDYAGGLRTPSGGNSGAYCGDNILTAHAEDLKFLYNLVAWGSANSQFRKDPRRTASSFEDIGAPLLKSFEISPVTAIRATDVVNSRTAPLVAKGVIYTTGVYGSTPVVRAYNAHPSLIIGDRGFPDLGLGASYDELWRWEGTGGYPSSPVLATIFNAAATPPYQDFIFVTLGDGTLVKLTALLADNFGNISPTPLVGSNGPSGGADTYTDVLGATIPAPAPVVHEGKVYVVEPTGLVRCVDAATLTTLWVSFNTTQTPVYKPNGSPTLGYTRMAITGESSTNAIRLPNGRNGNSYAANSNGSTNDLMLYVPVWQEDPNTGVRSLRTMAYWLGTRHEVLVTDDQTLGVGNFRTRGGIQAPAGNRQYVVITPGYPAAAPAGYPFIRPVVRVYTNTYNASGLVATATDNMAAGNPNTNFIGRFIDKNGIVRVEDGGGNPPTRGTVGTPPGFQPDNAIVSVDYDVYYITSSDTPPALASDGTNAARPTPALRTDGFLGGGEGIAITPDDILVSAFVYKNPSIAAALPFTTISGDYEQYGLTKLRQSVAAFENPNPLVALQIGNTSLVEVPTFRNRLRFAAPGGSNLSTGAVHMPLYEGLMNIVPVGPPITTNDGVTYQVLSATSATAGPSGNSIPVTIVAALDMNKEVVLNLPEAYNPSYRVQIEQLDPASFDPSNPQQAPSIRATLPQSGNSSISVSTQITGDASRGRMVLTDLRAANRRFSSTLSFIVTYVPAGGTSDKTVIVSPTPLLPDNGTGTDVDTRENGGTRLINGGYSPILWYYVLPGSPTSAATLSGNVLYMGMGLLGGGNAIVAVDANPASNDPNVRLGFGQQVETVVPQIDGTAQQINHVRWTRTVAGQVQGPPVGAQGVLAVNTTSGLAAFETGVTLIADSKRIIEVDAAGAALWSLDGTLEFKGVGGELPIGTIDGGILNPNATGRLLNQKRTLSHPAVARRLSASDYLICDTGNNRVVRVDRSGIVRWQLDRVNDPYHVLSSADPLTLNEPMDVQVYTQTSPSSLVRSAGSPLVGATALVGYEAHYLIADSGNNRIIEVVDYFDPSGAIRTLPGGVRGEQVVVWVSRTLQKEGRNLRFQSVQRILTTGDSRKLADPDTRVRQDPSLYGYPVIVAAVGNSSAAGDAGGGGQADFTGGSLLALEYFPINTAFPLFNSSTGAFINAGYGPWLLTEPEPNRNGLVDRTLNELVLPGGNVRRVTRPTFIQQISLPTGPEFLICDAGGVYQVKLVGQAWNVTWFFDANDYATLMAARLGIPGITRIDVGFQPTSVKRLANGSYLITSAWSGKGTKPTGTLLPTEAAIGQLMSSGQFVGEVFQVTPAKGFDGFAAPQLVVTVDAFGNRRYDQKMGGVTSNTNLLEHPLFGDRL